MSENIILTTGIYDLIKDHIKSKIYRREALKLQLRAQTVNEKNLPEEVVDIDKRVTVKNLDSDLEETYVLLLQIKQKKKKQNRIYII
jgi:regulator of nucleoside diphosphate kinase